MEKCRSGDSTWALVSEQELNKCLGEIEKMVDNDKVISFFRNERDGEKTVWTNQLYIFFILGQWGNGAMGHVT